ATVMADGSHTVSLVAYDAAGNTTAQQWNFTVDTNLGITFPEMPISNDAACWKCHSDAATLASSQYGIGSVAGKHPEVLACYRCHTTTFWGLRSFINCTNCHYGVKPANGILYLSYRHTSDGYPAFSNLPNVRHNIPDAHISSTKGCENCHSRVLTQEHFGPGRVDSNGNPITCDTCHTGNYLGDEVSTNGALKLYKSQANQVASTNPWYAPQGRAISRIYLDQALNSSESLEIYVLYNGKWGFLSQPGGKVSQWIDVQQPVAAIRIEIHPPSAFSDTAEWRAEVPKVLLAPTADNPKFKKIQDAIKNKDTRCGACHESGDHSQFHNSGLDLNCQSCHNGNLMDEHLSNTKTQSKTLSCEACHSSNAKEVKRTVAAGSLDCAGCHQQGHNVNFVDKVPTDIPLYGGYQWSTPMEASIFTGESSTPGGYDNGQLVMSNRRNDVTADQVWIFYSQQLPANGWTLKTAAPQAGVVSFTAEFNKDNRYVTVKCFNSENSDGTGTQVGYRVEVWFR
ncbi:MAG: hypothetical protein ACYC21_09745, partial [Eubacteriales bacterium]